MTIDSESTIKCNSVLEKLAKHSVFVFGQFEKKKKANRNFKISIIIIIGAFERWTDFNI